MALEYYDCPDHGNRIEVPEGKRPPRAIPCKWDGCRKRARHVGRVLTGLQGAVFPEIPSHFNRSLGCHVEGRKHLEHLQRQRGYSDFDPPQKAPSTSWA